MNRFTNMNRGMDLPTWIDEQIYRSGLMYEFPYVNHMNESTKEIYEREFSNRFTNAHVGIYGRGVRKRNHSPISKGSSTLPVLLLGVKCPFLRFLLSYVCSMTACLAAAPATATWREMHSGKGNSEAGAVGFDTDRQKQSRHLSFGARAVIFVIWRKTHWGNATTERLKYNGRCIQEWGNPSQHFQDCRYTQISLQCTLESAPSASRPPHGSPGLMGLITKNSTNIIVYLCAPLLLLWAPECPEQATGQMGTG